MAKYPASVHTALISAPENRSILSSSRSISTFFSRDMYLEWILKISFLPSFVGLSTWMCLSSLPGRKTAGSMMSFLFVHPMTLTLSRFLNPSSSESNCMNVRWTSRSPEVPTSTRTEAIASSSSIKIMLGDFAFARSKISLTSFAPSPMNFCTSSLPAISMNVLFVEFATALASRVFPVPGGPYRSIPFGGVIPIFLNSSGFLSGSSITSLISSI